MPAMALLLAVVVVNLTDLRYVVLLAVAVLVGRAIRWRAHRRSLLFWAGAVALLCTLPLLGS